MVNQRIRDLINWKLFFILWAAAIVSIAAIMPYIIVLQKEALSKVNMPMALMIALMLLQNSLVFAPVIAGGLWFARQIDLGLPLLEKLLNKQTVGSSWRKPIGLAVILGLASGVVIVLADFLFRRFGVVVPMESGSDMVWRGLLASFYGGIAEELFMRLGLMSLLAWLLLKVFKLSWYQGVMWLVIVVVALLFGLGHLPITASLTPITAMVVLRALVLNGIGGVVFGWLFWKRGLETAIIAHFSADLILHVVVPAFGA